MLLKPIKPKNKCICCRKTGVKITKEHVFPQWLIKKTGTHRTGIRWNNKRISAKACVVPICENCNYEFNENLEKPVRNIFNDLESQKGISDNEAELLVRWMWKTCGIAWCIANSSDNYTHTYNLRERALYPINNMRRSISLAISIIDTIDSSFGDAPMGFDSVNKIDCIFTAGVFSKIAIIVLLNCFVEELPSNFSIYNLFSKRENFGYMKTFFPKKGFKSCVDAVGVTRIISLKLSYLHDNLARESLKLSMVKSPKILRDYRI